MILMSILFACTSDKSDTATDSEQDTYITTPDTDTGETDTGDTDTGDTDTSDTDTSDTDTSDTDTSDTDTSDTGAVSDTIEAIQQGIIPVGQSVSLEQVVVASPANEFGFYVSNGTGGPNSGLFVYYYFNDAVQLNIQQGDILNVSGEVWEYPDTCEDYGDNDGDGLIDADDPDCANGGQEEVLTNLETMTEIKLLDPGDIQKLGESTEPLVSTLVDAAVLADPTSAEVYEGVLVRIENATVTSELDGYDQWSADNVIVGDLFAAEPGFVNEGDTIDVIQGILHFSYGEFKIVPRNADDVQGWNRTCAADTCIWDANVGDVFVSEFMADPTYCSDATGEYVEVTYNPNATQSLDLRGMSIEDSNTAEHITEHIVLNPGDSAWISSGTASCFGQPDFYLGSTSFGLNQAGDTLQLHYTDRNGSSTVFDGLTYDGQWVDGGVSIQLSPNNGAAENDLYANWCLSTELINGTTDYGTPGTVNTVCQ